MIVFIYLFGVCPCVWVPQVWSSDILVDDDDFIVSEFNAVAEGNDVNATFTCTQEKNGKALSAVWKATGSNDEHIASSSALIYTFSGDEINSTFELSKLVSILVSLPQAT